MPQAIIAIARPLVLWLIQAGVTTLLFAAVDFVLNKVQDIIRDYYGIDDKSAGAFWANAILDAAAIAGIGALVIAKKIPIKVAARMGLDATRPSKIPIPSTVTARIIAKDQAAAGKGAKSYIDNAFKIFGIPAGLIWLTSAIANIVEPGIYKPEQTNAVYKALNIPFQYPTASAAGSPGGFEPGEFTDYFRALETAGATSISNPCKLGNYPFNRDNLTALVDCIYGREAAAGRATSAAKLKVALSPYITLFNGGKASTTAGNNSSSGSSTGSGSGPSASTISGLPSVFTGLFSQGSLGNQDNFVPRPDDLIIDVDDLTKAAANNIAPFLAAIPGRIRYEIKVVSSYVDKSGYTHRGTTQKVPNGTFKDGTTKYKTITNKFAVAYMYILTEKGSRTKIDTIVLGPVDSGRFQPTDTDVVSMTETLQGTLVSSYSTAARSSSSSSKIQEEAEIKSSSSVSKPVATILRTADDGRFVYSLVYKTNKGAQVDSEYTGKNVAQVWGDLQNGGGFIVITLAGLTPGILNSGNYYDPSLPEDDPRSGRNIPASELEGRTSNTSGGRKDRGDRYEVIYDPKKDQWSVDDKETDKTSYFNNRMEAFAFAGQTDSLQDRYEVIYDPKRDQWSVDDKQTGKTTRFPDRASAFSYAGQIDTEGGGGSVSTAPLATTLSEYYQRQGMALPSLQVRGITYESLGLGAAVFYTGTAEQNTKLLNALQK